MHDPDWLGDRWAVETGSPPPCRDESARLGQMVSELMNWFPVHGAYPMPGPRWSTVARLSVDSGPRGPHLAADRRTSMSTCVPRPVGRCGATVPLPPRAGHPYRQRDQPNRVRCDRVSVTATFSTETKPRPTVDIAVTDRGIGKKIPRPTRDLIFRIASTGRPCALRANRGHRPRVRSCGTCQTTTWAPSRVERTEGAGLDIHHPSTARSLDTPVLPRLDEFDR